jgi:molecular chaperone DnaK (HSP70)
MTAKTQGKPQDSPIIGIDLGTTNSLVAHCTEAGPRIIASPKGQRSLPSVVRLSPRGEDAPTGSEQASGPAGYTVDALGDSARAHAVEFPRRTLHSVKRLMGRSVADLADDLPHLPYDVVEGPQQTARIALPTVAGTDRPITVTPQEVSAILLRELKRWADADLGTDVTRAVVTVPAYFDDAQRQATRDAGRLAGLDVLRIVNEPTAAALAYGLGEGPRGQGTEGPRNSGAEASRNQGAEGSSELLTLKPGPAESLHRNDDKAPDPPRSFSLNTQTNPAACTTPDDPSAPAADSTSASQTVAIYDLGGGTFDISILRLQQTVTGTIDQVLATDGDTHLGGDDFDQQIIRLLQTEIRAQRQQSSGRDIAEFPPATRQAFRRLAEQTKIKLSTEESAEIEIDLAGLSDGPTAAAEESTYRRTLTRAELETLIDPLLDRTLDACRRAMKNAGVDLTAAGAAGIDQVILVGGSTRLPRVRQRVAELFGRTPYLALDPDEVVALGASVQAAVLAGIKRDTLLLDVIPLSLGIETMGGAVAKLIVANSAIPARATEMFSTYAEGQTKVKIHVLQGERELVKDCRSLATFDLTGVPPMPAGLPKINVTFLVDANGILSVQAVEERSGRRAQVQVVPNHGLTRDEITQIEADSFTHARADMNAHRLIDLRLNARLDLRNIRKQLDRFEQEGPSENEKDEGLRGKGAEAERAAEGSSATEKSFDPAYRAQIEQHMRTVQRYIDTPDDENDADAFQQALHDLDHATLRLAELNIARTLREDAAAK